MVPTKCTTSRTLVQPRAGIPVGRRLAKRRIVSESSAAGSGIRRVSTRHRTAQTLNGTCHGCTRSGWIRRIGRRQCRLPAAPGSSIRHVSTGLGIANASTDIASYNIFGPCIAH
eukprot:165739-Rhodomonas_salina.1